MRINVYAEEMTDRVELHAKTIEGVEYTGLRLYLYLPATVPMRQEDGSIKNENVRGPFMHRPGDDDSSAITFWGKRDLRAVLVRMIQRLEEHEERRGRPFRSVLAPHIKRFGAVGLHDKPPSDCCALCGSYDCCGGGG